MRDQFMEYKGYIASIEVDTEDRTFHGEVLYLQDVISFEGVSFEELEESFHAALDSYLEWCTERGEEPNRAFSGNFPVRTDPELHRDAAIEAKRRGLSLNAFVSECIEKEIEASKSESTQGRVHELVGDWREFTKVLQPFELSLEANRQFEPSSTYRSEMRGARKTITTAYDLSKTYWPSRRPERDDEEWANGAEAVN